MLIIVRFKSTILLHSSLCFSQLLGGRGNSGGCGDRLLHHRGASAHLRVGTQRPREKKQEELQGRGDKGAARGHDLFSRSTQHSQKQWRGLLPSLALFIISAIATVILKSETCCFFQLIFVSDPGTYWKIQIFCSAVSISVRFKFLNLPTTIHFSCDGTSEW